MATARASHRKAHLDGVGEFLNTKDHSETEGEPKERPERTGEAFHLDEGGGEGCMLNLRRRRWGDQSRAPTDAQKKCAPVPVLAGAQLTPPRG